jgi:hypothetical protein
LLPLAAPAAVLVILLAFISVDPAAGVSASRGPFTDEAWNVVNARNLVLLGRWSTDDWNLHLVNVPFSVIEAAVLPSWASALPRPGSSRSSPPP